MTRAVARVMDVMETTPATHARRAQAAPTVRSRCLTVVGAPEHDAGTAPPPWVGSVSGLTDPMSGTRGRRTRCRARDRKSTRLNSRHVAISYAGLRSTEKKQRE